MPYTTCNMIKHGRLSIAEKDISIVTISYNSAKTIDKTIKSVITQNYDSMEYIVIDGNSSDGTKEVIRSFSNKIDIFVSEPDKGIADAFNKGISIASGKIIGLINSDDILLPGAVQTIIDFFSENQDIEVIHGDILLYDDDSFIKQIKPSGRWWYPWRLVLFNHPATFVKRSVYENFGGFNLEYRIAMDIEIFLRWRKAGVNIAYLPKPLVNMQAGGISGNHAFQGYKETKKAFIKYGYSPLWVNILYLARFWVHFIAEAQKKWRKLRGEK